MYTNSEIHSLFKKTVNSLTVHLQVNALIACGIYLPESTDNDQEISIPRKLNTRQTKIIKL